MKRIIQFLLILFLPALVITSFSHAQKKPRPSLGPVQAFKLECLSPEGFTYRTSVIGRETFPPRNGMNFKVSKITYRLDPTDYSMSAQLKIKDFQGGKIFYTSPKVLLRDGFRNVVNLKNDNVWLPQSRWLNFGVLFKGSDWSKNKCWNHFLVVPPLMTGKNPHR